MRNKTKLGFSLLEISVVLLIVGILLASVTAGRSLIKTSKLTSARSVTGNSPVLAVDGLAFWLETTLKESVSENIRHDDRVMSGSELFNISNSFPTPITSVTNVTYQDDGINAIPSFGFNGIDSQIVVGNDHVSGLIGSNFSIFIVEKRNSIGEQHIMGGAEETGDEIHIGYDAFNNFIFRMNATDTLTTTTAYADTTPAINYVTFAKLANESAPVGMTYYRNIRVQTDPVTSSPTGVTPTQAVSGNTTLLDAVTDVSIGASANSFSGNISEVIIYNRNITFTELDEVMKYLSSKYSIQLSDS